MTDDKKTETEPVHVCPCCGYCPTCGRARRIECVPHPYPYYPYWEPQGPIWITTGTTTTDTQKP